MKTYTLRKLSFYTPNTNQVEDLYSYTSNPKEWATVSDVLAWAERKKTGALAQKILSTPVTCLSIDMVMTDLNEAEAKTAKLTAIALAETLHRGIVNVHRVV